ncbi:MAG: LysR family transcriptional regulator [Pseudomonadota bacterium]
MQTRDIDTTLLRTFVEVAQTGAMTKAGRHLNLTQSAVSQQIKRLEDLFQVELFDRSQKLLKLTALGERLLPKAQSMLSLNNEIWHQMTSPDFEGQVRLGVPHDIVQSFMPRILKSFRKLWPTIDVQIVCLTTPKLLALLDKKEIDLTLTTEAKKSENDGTLLLIDQLVWAGVIDGEAYKDDPLSIAIEDETCAFRPCILEALARIGRKWRLIDGKGDGMPVMIATLQADLAIAATLSQAIPPSCAVLPPDSNLPTLPHFYINMYQAPGRDNAIVQELASHMTKSFNQLYPKVA